jgi:hypothetical protein
MQGQDYYIYNNHDHINDAYRDQHHVLDAGPVLGMQ